MRWTKCVNESSQHSMPRSLARSRRSFGSRFASSAVTVGVADVSRNRCERSGDAGQRQGRHLAGQVHGWFAADRSALRSGSFAAQAPRPSRFHLHGNATANRSDESNRENHPRRRKEERGGLIIYGQQQLDGRFEDISADAIAAEVERRKRLATAEEPATPRRADVRGANERIGARRKETATTKPEGKE